MVAQMVPVYPQLLPQPPLHYKTIRSRVPMPGLHYSNAKLNIPSTFIYKQGKEERKERHWGCLWIVLTFKENK